MMNPAIIANPSGGNAIPIIINIPSKTHRINVSILII